MPDDKIVTSHVSPLAQLKEFAIVTYLGLVVAVPGVISSTAQQ